MAGFDKVRFAELLKLAMGNRSLNKYAEASGVSNAHVSRLQRGLLEKAPEAETIKKLAEAAHNEVTYAMLMEAAGHFTEGSLQQRLVALKQLQQEMLDADKLLITNKAAVATAERDRNEAEAELEALLTLEAAGAEHVSTFLRVPVLGSVAAGLPITAQEDVLHHEVIPNPGCREGELFFLIVKGDSMIGSRIYEGDKVLVKVQPDVEDGQIAVVNVDGESATLKRVKRMNGKVLLLADNPKYEPIIVNSEKARVCGKVIQVVFDPNKRF
ncbi:S24 family peptidase [Paenibacillus agilis]|uniref:Helix-turn-helix domain-containing protein n=1 Tax=Paenibacillus agilis TaxID=3020863 RepID=A0A559IX82_9BACL|nr:S24 family peptidase [Paenibacillus agilis]TVX92247.1 helix-turn-helix domain-containing protein [Paenibacillus agilis]